MDINDARIENEIAHGRHLRDIWSGTLKYWETPAGRIRWNRRVEMLMSHILADMDVLEIGCGVGYFTKEIVKTKANVTAIDVSPDLLEVAKSNISEPNVSLMVGNAYDLEFPDNSFDSIIGSSVLHHLDTDKALAEFFRVLKPAGTLYFTEPNMINPIVYWGMHTSLGAKIIEKSPDEMAFERWQFQKQLSAFNFCDIKIMPFDFMFPPTPFFLIAPVKVLGDFLEKIPLIKEIAGCLYIVASKGGS